MAINISVDKANHEASVFSHFLEDYPDAEKFWIVEEHNHLYNRIIRYHVSLYHSDQLCTIFALKDDTLNQYLARIITCDHKIDRSKDYTVKLLSGKNDITFTITNARYIAIEEIFKNMVGEKCHVDFQDKQEQSVNSDTPYNEDRKKHNLELYEKYCKGLYFSDLLKQYQESDSEKTTEDPRATTKKCLELMKKRGDLGCIIIDAEKEKERKRRLRILESAIKANGKANHLVFDGKCKSQYQEMNDELFKHVNAIAKLLKKRAAEQDADQEIVIKCDRPDKSNNSKQHESSDREQKTINDRDNSSLYSISSISRILYDKYRGKKKSSKKKKKK